MFWQRITIHDSCCPHCGALYITLSLPYNSSILSIQQLPILILKIIIIILQYTALFAFNVRHTFTQNGYYKRF